MLNYKIPTSITLAQGVLKDRSVNSDLAREANNHFGVISIIIWTGPRMYKDSDLKKRLF
ncbi:MAG: glucosaminidase domain-containing protein [Crocinitomicaceae bacterium]